jgi:hypothetical protein
MADLQPGDRVRWTKAFRKRMFWAQLPWGEWSCRGHIREFRRCVGIIEGPMDYNNVPVGHQDYDPAKVGPEVNVRWQPSNLRYGYLPTDLERVP